MEYLGAWGTLIHEKNLKSKISCQTPFQSQSGTAQVNMTCLNIKVIKGMVIRKKKACWTNNNYK